MYFPKDEQKIFSETFNTSAVPIPLYQTIALHKRQEKERTQRKVQLLVSTHSLQKLTLLEKESTPIYIYIVWMWVCESEQYFFFVIRGKFSHYHMIILHTIFSVN